MSITSNTAKYLRSDGARLEIEAIADGEYLKRSGLSVVGDPGSGGGPVKATGAELDTGTDDAKFATAKALADSAYAKTSDIPAPGSSNVGYLNIPQNSQSADYTAVLSDTGKHLYHPVADDNPRTFTIPANASVAYAIGTALTFVNDQNTLTIAITSDTLVWAEDSSTGSRTLAENGIATALKVTATRWIISGVGLS